MSVISQEELLPLTEKQLLPILQFTERLILITHEYKRSVDIGVKYNSENYSVRYILDVELTLGKYQAVLELFYDETENKNDWEDLTRQLEQLEKVINT
jgi:hypothetical protein